MKKVILITFLSVVLLQVKAQDPKGQTVVSFIAPTDSLDEYYTHDDYFGLTATKIVKSILERDKIPTARRREGMKVYVQSVDRWYKLYDCIGNNCWIEDRIDTLRYGTFSTGKITVQPEISDPSFLYDAYTKAGYQRFGISKNGLLLAGRRMPAFLNVDALAWIGDRNELLATDGIAFGKDLIVDGDTSAAFGYNLHSTFYNSIVFGRGKDRQNRIKNRYPWSVNFGAFQTIPQIELTQDTIRLNSTVLWWNGAPIGGSYSFPYTQTLTSNINWTSVNNSMFYQMGSAPYYSTWLLQKNYMRVSSNGDWRSGFFGVYPDRIDISMTSLTGNSDLRIDTTGISYTAVDTSLFSDNHLATTRYVKDRIGGVWGRITGNFADQTDINNAINSKQNNLNAPGSSAYFLRSDLTWQIIPTSFPGFGTLNSTAARGDHNHSGVYLTPNGDGSSLTGLSKYQVNLGSVDNTSDLNKPISTATQTALNAKEPTIPTGNSGQYIAGDKTLKDFPVKYMLIDVPNANLTTSGTGSRIQILAYMPQNSIVLGATLTLNRYESSSTRLSAIIGSSASYPILTLTNIEPEMVGYNFVPNSTRYGGNVLYFEVTSTNITDTQMVGKLSFAYIPIGL